MSQSTDSVGAAHQAVLEGIRVLIRYLKDCCAGEDVEKWEKQLAHYEGYNSESRTDEQSICLGNMLLEFPSALLRFANAANRQAKWIYVRDMLISWTAINDLVKGGTDYHNRAPVQAHLKRVEAEIERLRKESTAPIPHGAPDGVN